MTLWNIPITKIWNGVVRGYGRRYGTCNVSSEKGESSGKTSGGKGDGCKGAPCVFDGKFVGTCKPAKIPKPPVEKLCEDECCPKIAILGAGMAGMSAASELHKAGVQNYTVYEANNRVGGRIYSAWCGEGLNELGAEWLEGEWNPILRLASLEGLTPCEEDSGSGIYLGDDGRPLITSIVEEAKDKMQMTLDYVVKSFCENREDDFFEVSLLDFIKRNEHKMKWKDPIAKDLFNTMTRGGTCKLGGPADQISLNDVTLRFRSEIRQRIREGLVAVFGPMMKDVPTDKLKLKHRVQSIQWDECPIKITFQDCSEETADFVIITFSLGVLKHDELLFEPALPENKLEAIKHTGYDVVNKIFLDYAEPFWLRGDGRVFLSRSMNHEAKDWESSIFEVREICGGRNTLQISLCGPPAVEIEYVAEEDIAKKVTPLLRKFTGVAITPYPIGVTKTRWSTDPHFMGSMSFMGKNSNKRHLSILALPLPTLQAIPKLLFAGDATSGGYIGTVEGARLSGFREAHRIIDIICTHGWPPRPRHNLQQFIAPPCPT